MPRWQVPSFLRQTPLTQRFDAHRSFISSSDHHQELHDAPSGRPSPAAAFHPRASRRTKMARTNRMLLPAGAFFCARPTTSARSAIAFLVMRTSPVLRRRTDWKNRGRQTCKGSLKSQGSDQKNTSRPGRPCCRDEVCSKSYPFRNPDFLARRARKCRRFCGKTLRRNASIRIVRSFHQRSVR